MEQNEIYAIENGKPNGGQGSDGKGGRHFFCGLLTGLATALLIVSVTYLLNRMQVLAAGKDRVPDKQTSAENDDKKDYGDNTAITPEMIEKLQLIEEVIDTYYWKEDIDRKVLEEGAYRGMVEALGDPYSEYFSEEELQSLYQDSLGVYFGIGAKVQLDTATTLAKISGVISNTPAEEADLHTNDLIYKVDGTETYGMSLQEVVSLIKGEEGTYVHLTLIRDGKEIEKDVVRRKVESPTVESEMYDNGIAYIQITEFDSITVDQFAEALAVARGQGMKGDDCQNKLVILIKVSQFVGLYLII